MSESVTLSTEVVINQIVGVVVLSISFYCSEHLAGNFKCYEFSGL